MSPAHVHPGRKSNYPAYGNWDGTSRSLAAGLRIYKMPLLCLCTCTFGSPNHFQTPLANTSVSLSLQLVSFFVDLNCLSPHGLSLELPQISSKRLSNATGNNTTTVFRLGRFESKRRLQVGSSLSPGTLHCKFFWAPLRAPKLTMGERASKVELSSFFLSFALSTISNIGDGFRAFFWKKNPHVTVFPVNNRNEGHAH